MPRCALGDIATATCWRSAAGSGHAFTEEALLAIQADQLEAALWTALRALEEHSALSRRLAARAANRGHSLSASTFTEQAMDAEHHASTIRSVLSTGVRDKAYRGERARARTPRMIAPDDGAPEATGDELAEASEALATSTADPGWAELLQYLHVARGFDFQGYKPTTLARRVRKRMNMRGIESYDAYQDYLEVHPDEFTPAVQHHPDQRHQLLPRPAEPGSTLRTEVIAPLLAAKPAASRSGSGAPAAPPARRPTRSPWCSPRRWGSNSSASG